MQNIKHAVAISYLLFGRDLSNSTKSAASESQTSPLALPLLVFLAAEHCQVLRAAGRQGVPASGAGRNTAVPSGRICLLQRQEGL